LAYLGWGLRDYGCYPTRNVESERNIWSYNLILRGSPTILLSDGPHRLSTRDAVLFSGHGSYPFRFQDRPGKLCEVLIWTWRTPPVIREATPPRGGFHLCRMNDSGCERLKAAYAACRMEVAQPDELTNQFLRGVRAQIDIEFVRARQGRQRTVSDQLRAEEAVRWLRQHLATEEPIFELCEYLRISDSTLGRIFRSVFGESAKRCHHRLRMQEAERLLKEEKLLGKQVAFRLGYKHHGDFSRAFKAYQKR
jgi:AraC-like DNA-binding protein